MPSQTLKSQDFLVIKPYIGNFATTNAHLAVFFEGDGSAINKRNIR